MTRSDQPHRFAATRTGALSHRALTLALGLLAIAGCDKRDSVPKGPPARPIRNGTATIRGIVRLQGDPPPTKTIRNDPCHPGAKSISDETVVTDGAGHLQNVVVYLENAPGAAAAAPAPVVLDQVDCRYVPHVLALRTGQTLRVTNSDPTLHNVHGACEKNPAFNFAQVRAGQTSDLSFTRPEHFIIRCDVHPWMRAHVQVFDHPWFVVTAKDGTFKIDHVPAGSYTLIAWQEKYGEARTAVQTANGKTANVDLIFQSGL